MSDIDSELDFQLAKSELLKAKLKLSELSRNAHPTPPYCSFCQRGKGQYLFCVEGLNNVRICETCAFDVCESVVNELNNM